MTKKLIIHVEPEAKINMVYIYRPWEDIPIPESMFDKNVIKINRKGIFQINIYAWEKDHSKIRLENADLKKPELYCMVRLIFSSFSRDDVEIIVKKSDLHTFLGEIDYSKPLFGDMK